MQTLEKIAVELEKAADFIEKHEVAEKEAQEKEAQKKLEEETTKRSELLTPIKEKLSSIVDDDSEIDEKLKTASNETLELINKSLSKESSAKVEEDWGHVEENKVSRGKYAGYRDPIEAFALGD